MPRQPRYALAGMPQHVIQRGNNRQSTFFAEPDYPWYLDCLKEACTRHGCRVHAYVLMTNHVHLLITPDEPHGIANVMQSVGRRYVRYVNDIYRRSGTLWEGRYKASLVNSEEYLLACYRYIELNPVRANLVRQAREYPWSSYAHHVGDRTDPVISDHPLYLALGRTEAERNATYRELCNRDVDDVVLAAVRATTNQCLILGSELFKDQIEQAIARRVRHGKAGRPKRKIAV